VKVKAKDAYDFESDWSQALSVEIDSQPPTTPSIPSGETSGYILTSYCYTTVTTDPDGDQLFYMFDWGDGRYSEWLGGYASGQPCTDCITWSIPGIYYVRAKAKDEWGEESDWSQALYVQIGSHEPDTPSKPNGENSGHISVSYCYTTVTTDPDGDQISYLFDWGDGTNSGWLGAYNSEQPCTACNAWPDPGTYYVRAKAKDVWGEESDWSDSLRVVIMMQNIYVDALNIDPPWDGSYENPYRYIQDGLDAASMHYIVLIADGTYRGAKNRNLDFDGKTIIVKSENGPENCIIDCQLNGRGFNFHSGETENAVLQELTIRNGYASGSYPNNCGGGIFCYGASPTIIDNIITENTAEYGGGIYCGNSTPVIMNNTLEENISEEGGGGGICCYYYASPQILNNVIRDNHAIGTDGWGGGILCYGASPTIRNNRIRDNGALGSNDAFGGGIFSYDGTPIITGNTIRENWAMVEHEGDYAVGGGIFCSSASPMISGNTLSRNEVYGQYGWGGGIHCEYADSLTISGNTIESNETVGSSSAFGGGLCFYSISDSTFSNNLVTWNETNYEGAGMACYESSMTIASSTFEANKILLSGGLGGGIYCEDSFLTIIDSIMWNDMPNAIYVSSGEWPTVSYSVVCEGGGAYPGTGNICANPHFARGPLGDHYLSQEAAGQWITSSCVDMGSDDAEDICFETADGTICMDQLTTRTDLIGDTDEVDIGFHFPMTGQDVELPPNASSMEEVPDIGDDPKTRWMD